MDSTNQQLVINTPDDVVLKVTLKQDNSNPTPRFNLSGGAKNRTLELYNFDKAALGLATQTPITLLQDTVTHITTYLSFVAYKIGEAYILHYNFFEKSQNQSPAIQALFPISSIIGN